MKGKRSFSKEFKRRVVEEWAAGQIGPAQLCRKYEISPGLLYHWKRQYSRGKYDNEPTSEGIMMDRIKELEVTKPNQVWVSDITYVRLLYEFVYLAAILDKYSRKAIGYALTDHIDSRLTLQALDMAIARRNPAPGCIHHSDRGVQYACVDYVSRLKRHGLLISMTRKGNPYENAGMESFFKTLKYEEVYLWEYRTLEEAQMRIDSFIEEVYNKKRLHSSLGYVPPEEYEILHKGCFENGQTILTQTVQN